MTDLTLSDAEINNLTRYRKPQRQVAELRKRGFAMATIVRGKVSLPRDHYLSVCQGIYGGQQSRKPTWKPDFTVLSKLCR